MSEYSNTLEEISMCPCTIPKDIPQDGVSAVSHDENELMDNGFEVLSGDSGSDEEQDSLVPQGYVPLSQNEGEIINMNDENEDENVVSTDLMIQQESTVSAEMVEPVPSRETSFAFTTTSKPPMTQDKVNQIKSIMSNIKLPTSSIPEWAKRIPEENWIAPFVSSLPNRNNDDKTEETTS